MKIDIITYNDGLQQDLKSMLRDYLNLVAEEVKHDPWRFEVNIAEALDFTFQNLSDFTPPKGKIFIAQNSNQTRHVLDTIIFNAGLGYSFESNSLANLWYPVTRP